MLFLYFLLLLSFFLVQYLVRYINPIVSGQPTTYSFRTTLKCSIMWNPLSSTRNHNNNKYRIGINKNTLTSAELFPSNLHHHIVLLRPPFGPMEKVHPERTQITARESMRGRPFWIYVQLCCVLSYKRIHNKSQFGCEGDCGCVGTGMSFLQLSHFGY